MAKPACIMSIEFDNDVYFETDYYYSNGVGFELIHPDFNDMILTKLLWPVHHYDHFISGIKLDHKIFTPTALDTKDILSDDRPFAAYFTVSAFKISYDPLRRSKTKSSLSMGLLGPSAFGRELQNLIHDDIPFGWVNQIRNDIIINYDIRFENSLYSSGIFEILNSAGIRLGSLYDMISGGLRINLGNFSIFNSIHGFNFRNVSRKLHYSFFCEAKAELVAYDATLQGGVFNKSSVFTLNYSNIEKLRMRYSAGFVLRYSHLSFNARANLNSPQFKGARMHKWLHLGLSFLF